MSDLLAELVLGWADDSLILGHRNSEWAGHGPILEEDIAFSNLALDELGHAQLWYGLHQELTGSDPDRLVFFRDAPGWRNTQLVELPRGDWAFSMLRQYLFDVYENVLLSYLVESKDTRIAAIAAKIRSEEIYHLRYTSNRVKRLGLGTSESRARMQRALDELWGYGFQLWHGTQGWAELKEMGILPEPILALDEWYGQVSDLVLASGLNLPKVTGAPLPFRGEHTEHLQPLLDEMQAVARTEEFGVEW